jgi:hypothetical protein
MRQYLVRIKSLAGRTFANTMHTLSAERRRVAEERARLLESEGTACAQAEKARQEARTILDSISHAFFTPEAVVRRFAHAPQAVGTESYQINEGAAKVGVSVECETISPVSRGSVIAGQIRPSTEGL